MSSLTINPAGDLALQLASAGSKTPKALALVCEHWEITTDALDLARIHAQPKKLQTLFAKGFKLDQVFAIYEALDGYAGESIGPRTAPLPPINLLADFAEWFLGVDFTEVELQEAIEAAIRMFPKHWKHGNYPLSAELSYALGCGKSTRNKSIEGLEEAEFGRNEGCVPEEEFDLGSDEGQGE